MKIPRNTIVGQTGRCLGTVFLVSRASNINSYSALTNKQELLLVSCIYERIMHALIDFVSEMFVVMFIILSIVTLELWPIFCFRTHCRQVHAVCDFVYYTFLGIIVLVQFEHKNGSWQHALDHSLPVVCCTVPFLLRTERAPENWTTSRMEIVRTVYFYLYPKSNILNFN
jgi:hypothetical protein